MPTKREREYYAMGYRDGMSYVTQSEALAGKPVVYAQEYKELSRSFDTTQKRKRKLSAWNKFVKANAKKPRFRLRSGSPNLKKLGVAFRKTPAGKKKRR